MFAGFKVATKINALQKRGEKKGDKHSHGRDFVTFVRKSHTRLFPSSGKFRTEHRSLWKATLCLHFVQGLKAAFLRGRTFEG